MASQAAAYVYMLGGMATGPDAAAGAVAEDEGRMPRKLVAFRTDQLVALRRLAGQRTDDPGNVSAEVREAVDTHIALKEGMARDGGSS